MEKLVVIVIFVIAHRFCGMLIVKGILPLAFLASVGLGEYKILFEYVHYCLYI